MSHQEAASVVARPLDVVQEQLRKVENWPMFLDGLFLVTKVAHQRYRLVVTNGRITREVDAAVLEHIKDHRFTWRALEGPRYEGEIRLSAVDDEHTKIRLSFTSDPVGFVAGLSEMFSSGHNDIAVNDLSRLETHLGAPASS